jgi:hypothetical protein
MFGDTTIASAIDAVKTAGGGTTVTCAIGQGGSSWALSGDLKSSGTWCVSSTGQSISGAASGGGASADASCS